MNLHSIGIDFGKTVFHLIGLNQSGEVVVRKKFSRLQLLRFTANVHAQLIAWKPAEELISLAGRCESRAMRCV